MSTTTLNRPAVRRTFIGLGAVLIVGMLVAIVVALMNGATLFVPMAAAVLALGVLYVWGGVTGYVDQQVERPVAEPDSDKDLYVAGVLLGILIPVVGFVVGVVLLIRGNNRYGLMAMIGSIGASILWYLYLTR